MIDISLYISKLEALKEYIALSIHDRLPTVVQEIIAINIQCVPYLNVDQLLAIWDQTGMMFYCGGDKNDTHYRSITFDEWVNKTFATNYR